MHLHPWNLEQRFMFPNRIKMLETFMMHLERQSLHLLKLWKLLLKLPRRNLKRQGRQTIPNSRTLQGLQKNPVMDMLFILH